MTTKPNAQPNQSLIDGITTLQALATSETAIGGRELARRLGFEPTRVNRLLKTLAYIGIARQTPNRKYTSGPGMYVLAAQSLFASGFIQTAMPVLESLRRFNLVVALGVLWQDTVSYLYHAKPGMSSVDALGRVGIYPATRGGIGLSLLAQYSSTHVEQLFHEKEIPGFETLSELQDTLATITQEGYARIQVTEDPMQHTIAIPIGNPAHAAIGLSGWIPDGSVNGLLDALREAATTIESGVLTSEDVEVASPTPDFKTV